MTDIIVARSEKTSLITAQYTHSYYGISLVLYMLCIFCKYIFTEFLRFLYIHGETCVKILCSEKELLHLKD